MSPALELEGLELRFGARALLSGLDLRVAPGEQVGIVGPNGAGKSTLLGVAAGRIPARRGAVRLLGEDVTRTDPVTRSRRGLVEAFQGEALAPRLSPAAHLRLAGVSPAEWSGRLALGPHLETPASALDRPTRRRLGLALALARRPAVLLLDEPFAGLPADGRADMLAALEVARERGAAVVWVEHEHAFLRAHVDRVLELDDGRLRPAAIDAPEAERADAPGPPARTAIRLRVDLRVELDGGARAPVGLELPPGSSALLPDAGGPVAEALLGFRPSAGILELDGRPLPLAPDARRRAGLAGVLAPPCLIGPLSLDAHLRLALDPAEARALFARLLPEASARRGTLAGHASGGERRLLALALALAGAPRALLLEDARTGLDPARLDALAALLAALRARGGVVLFVGPSAPVARPEAPASAAAAGAAGRGGLDG